MLLRSTNNRVENSPAAIFRDRDKTRLSVLRMVKSAVKYREIEVQRPLSDDEATAVLRKEVKLRQDALDTVQGMDRADFTAALRAELAVLYTYLPASLSEEEIRAIVSGIVTEVGATSRADMGKVMSAVMNRVGVRAEGKTVNRIVQEHLSHL
ncbi:MAG: GatB/YqeY domain-containing protein [Bacilli bacterium]